jgi:hypothetical protein
MNTFIQQAEKRIFVAVQFPALRKNVTGTMTTNSKYVSTPTDFLSAYSFAVINPVTGAYTYPLPKDADFIREAYPSPTDTGTPKYYALFGPTSSPPPNPAPTTELSFIVGPTPDLAYAVELHYFYMPDSIVLAGTSWLGDNFDPALLYGTLVEAYTFMKGETDMMAKYDAMFKDALTLAKRLGDGMEKSDTYRNAAARVPVT